MASLTIQQALDTGVNLQKAGRLDEAEQIYRQVLAQHPNTPDALHFLGLIYSNRGQNEKAIELIRQAIQLNSTAPVYHSNLGRILHSANRINESIQAYRQVLALCPNSFKAHHDLAIALHAARRRGEAIIHYRRALEITPTAANAWSDLAYALIDEGEFSEALACCDKALAIRPDFAEAIGARGNALRELGRVDQAITELERAIAIRPEIADFHNNLAIALRQRGRFDGALAALDKTIALRPKNSGAWSNRASILRDMGRLDESVAASRRAIELNPEMPEAHLNLATAMHDACYVESSIASARRAIQLRPEFVEAHNLLGNVMKEDGSVAEAIEEFEIAIALAPRDAKVHSNRVYISEFHPDFDARTLLTEQRRWNQAHAEPLKHFIRPHENDRSPDRKLRIGYVSSYFQSHSESFFVVPLLESHDHERFEVHCYSQTARPDDITERHRRRADGWHDCLGLTDAELADQIRADRIDVLVDLMMHMARNRATMFARKPAPVQVAWLAYPGGTGMDAMDYHITDPWIDPPGSDLSCYHEKSISLPNSWCCYDPLGDASPAAPRLDGPIRFGSINNPCKLNEPLLRLWGRVLLAVTDSRLLLQSVSSGQQERIFKLYESLGISRSRVEFVGRCLRPQYLRLYDRIDICLDPLPYNGITTSCDALWMGVPVVTLAGKTAAGRAGTSILANVGLSDLAAANADQFVRIASDLAADSRRLAELRGSLRDRMRGSPLMDGRRFASDMEAAYRRMWRTWCAG